MPLPRTFASLASTLGLGVLLFASAGCPGSSLASLGEACSGTGRGTASGCRAGLTCSFNRCRDRCETSRDCDAGLRCLVGDTGNVCSLPVEDTCRAASDCTSGLECARGECRTQCADDTECGTGGTCASGTCTEPVSVSMPDGSPCTSDEGCRGGSVCALDRCRPSCAAGCDRSSRCLSDMGVLGCSLPDEDTCGGAGDCPGSLSCVAEECRTPCTTDGDCAPGGRCTMSSCDEPQSMGRIDAAIRPGTDAGIVPDQDAFLVRLDGGARGDQTQLATAFTAVPLPSQTVEVLAPYLSPPFSGRDIVLGSMLAPIGVSLTARPDADGRGVGYVGAVDGAGVAHLFRFPGDAPSMATDRSSDLAAATSLVDLALAEDGTAVRALLLRDRSADVPASQAGWTWAEGGAPSAYDRSLGFGGHGVYTFGQAAIAGGVRSIGPDQDLRYLVRERERLEVSTDPVTYEPGNPFLSALDTGRTQAASDATSALFTSDVLTIRALPDFALVWDPETGLSSMLRLREEGGILRTGYERLGFLDATEAAPAIAQQALIRTEAVIAAPNGPSTALHRISCPEPTECTSTSMVFLPTPGGTTATATALAPLRGGYALVTVDAEGIVLRALSRELVEIPGYDDGSRLAALGTSTLSDGGSYALMDLDAYAFEQENVDGITSVTLLVAALYYNFIARTERLWVGGVRAEVNR